MFDGTTSRFASPGALTAIVLLLAAVAAPAPAQVRLFGTTGYGGGSSSTLVELDPATGALVATIGPVGYLVNGLDYDPTSGVLYGGTSYNESNFNGLIQISMTTGAGTPVGANYWGRGDRLAITNITVNSAGAMYGWSEWCDCLVSIDKATGVATDVGGSGVSTYEYGLSFNSTDVLYLVNGDGSFYTVDTGSGAATYHGSVGQTAHHGDFHPVSDLYYGLTWTYGSPRTLLVCTLAGGSCSALAEVGALHTLAFVPGAQPEGADLSITKTDGATTEVPGTGITYTIVVANSGPSADPSVAVADTFPASLTNVTWTASATGAATGFTAAGSWDLNDTGINMPSGSTVTYTVGATIDPAATGTLANTATVTASVTDPDGTDNSATDSDTLQPTADVSITKTVEPAVVQVGDSVVFTIVVANAGPSGAPSVTVTDAFPPQLVSISWTCAALGGAACTASGAGDIDDTASLPPGSSVTYTATATVAPGWSGDLSNTAAASLPAGVTDPTTADHSSAVTLFITNPIPALGGPATALLTLLLGLGGLWLARRTS